MSFRLSHYTGGGIAVVGQRGELLEVIPNEGVLRYNNKQANARAYEGYKKGLIFFVDDSAISKEF
jgi:hypothetical protein